MKYFRRGVSQCKFLPTIASVTAPSQAEITAGTDLTKAVTAIANFTTTVARITQPVLAYTVSPQIAGSQTFGSPQLTMLEDNGVSDTDSAALIAAYTALADGVTGYIILSPGTTAATKKGEVWPIIVGANNRDWSTADVMAEYNVDLAVTNPPTKNATFAA